MLELIRRFCKKVYPFDMKFTARVGNQNLSPCGFVFYRIVMLVLCVANFALVEVYSHQADFLYFTFWGLVLTLITFSFMTLEAILTKTIHAPWTMKLWKVSHFLYTLTLVLELFLNGVYWVGMFPVAMVSLWGQVGFMDIFVLFAEHLIPLVLLIIDLHMNYVVLWNYAYTLFHTLFLFVYLGINMAYTLNHRTPVYPLITWKNLISYIFLVSCAIAIPICHLVVIHYCKWFKQKVIKRILEQNQSLGSVVPMARPYSTFQLSDKITVNTESNNSQNK